MKIIIAPDSFKESLTALEVADAIEAGLTVVLPHAQCVKIPMADGGEGTVQSLIDATAGTLHTADRCVAKKARRRCLRRKRAQRPKWCAR